jgi:hypothetical protein
MPMYDICKEEYSCISEGKYLIPWMGDESLKTERSV